MKNQNQPTFDVFQGPLVSAHASTPLAQLLANDQTSPWSTPVLERYRAAAKRQRAQSETLRNVYRDVPNLTTNLEAANADLLSNAHTALAEYLGADNCNTRLALYLPLELLPSNAAKGSALPRSARLFVDAYVSAWEHQLRTSEYRANFLDGDIPEPALRNTLTVPRIIKAGQLVPALLARNIITQADVERLCAAGANPLLVQTTQEACSRAPQRIRIAWRPMLVQALTTELLHAYSTETVIAKHGAMPPKRLLWLQQEQRRALVQTYATYMVQSLRAGTITSEVFVNQLLLSSHECVQAAAITALRQCAATEPVMAEMLCCMCAPFLEPLWQTSVPWIQSEIESTTFHLQCYKHTRDVVNPIPHDYRSTKPFTDAVEKIVSTPTLKERLFPVVVAYGSRMKGYGAAGADVDLAVLVRPHVPFEERELLRNTLQHLLPEGSAVSEFWLSEKNHTCELRTPEQPDTRIHDMSSVYPLLCGTWIGEHTTQERLYADLLEPYLHPAFRPLLLPELERCVLQYRLMHRGYHHCYPVLQPARGDATVDTHYGAFWDPGYRRLASVLFLEELFVPL